MKGSFSPAILRCEDLAGVHGGRWIVGRGQFLTAAESRRSLNPASAKGGETVADHQLIRTYFLEL